jgi:hypothetical protein
VPGTMNSHADLVPGRAGDASHYNGPAVEMTRAVRPQGRRGRNAKVRTGCEEEFS